MEQHQSLSADDKIFWEAKSREKIALQPTIRGAIVDAMRSDPKISWESIEADDAINYWCSADTLSDGGLSLEMDVVSVPNGLFLC